jgi:hypothetical protein
MNHHARFVAKAYKRHTTISLKSKMRKFRGDSQAVERGRFLLSQPSIALLFESTKAIYPF